MTQQSNPVVRLGQTLKRASLRWQICVLTGLSVLLSLCAMAYFSFTKSRDVVTDARLDALYSETRVATSILDHAIRAARADLVEVPRFPPIPGIVRCLDNNGMDPDPLQQGSTTEIWIQRLGTILSAQMAHRPERLRATVVDQNLREIAFVNGTKNIRSEDSDSPDRFRNAEFAREALQKNPGYVVFSETSVDRVTGSQVLHLATPFAAEDGSIRGAFIISLDAGLLFEKAAETVTSGTTDIVDQDGTYLYCEDNPEYARSGREYATEKPVRAAFLAEKGSAASFKKLIPGSERPDGVTLIAIYQKFYFSEDDPNRFWAVAPSIDARMALNAVTEIANRFIWLGVFLIGIVGTFTFFASKGLTSSLEQLALTADKIAQGKLDTAIPDNNPIGEVKGLRDSLSTMTRNLRNTIKSAEQHEKRTAAILNSTADGIISITADGRIQSINTAALRLFGITRDDAIHCNVGKWIPALHDEDVHYENTPLNEGEVRPVGSESEVLGHHRTGRTIPLAMRVTEMEHVGERLYIATVQNITERKQAEEERRKSEQERVRSEQERMRLFDGVREAVKSLAIASTEILSTTTQQASSAQQQAASVTETATTVEELTHTAEESSGRAQAVADSADRAEQVGRSGRTAVDATIVAMQHVRQQVESIAENIMSLSDRAQAIEGIIDAVKDIADQTNLLALNAAIEASRAGEHGRGFAVVASEVKALADQSRKATEKVGQILGKIQQGTNSAVLATEQGTKSVTEAENVIREADSTIDTLSGTINDASVSARQILASANQQAVAMRQIRDAINHIDQATKQTLAATRQSEQSARDLNELGDRLNRLIDESDDVDRQSNG